MDGRGGDTQSSLWRHARFFCPLDAWNDVANIVQTIENARDIHALGMFHLVHQGANVIGYGIHAQCIQSTIEHVCLDTHLVKGCAEGADSIVRVLACQQIYLFKSASVGFYTSKTAHFYNDWSNAF